MADQQHAALAVWCRVYSTKAGEPQSVVDRRSADASAAWLRWHEDGSDSCILAAHRGWYTALERARVEALASADLPGMRLNLKLDTRTETLEDWLYLSTAEWMADAQFQTFNPPTVEPAPQSVPRVWRFWCKSREASLTPEQLRHLWRETVTQAGAMRYDGKAYASLLIPLLDACARYVGPILPETRVTATFTPQAAKLDTEDAGLAPQSSEEMSGTQRRWDSLGGYRIYSKAWDELLTTRDLERMTTGISWTSLGPLAADVQRLASRLQRRLMAARLRRWSFAEEDGVLDNRRLAQLLTSGADGRVFRCEAQDDVTAACVTLLVDQSRSMRGKPAVLAVQAIDLAVGALQRCGVRCEVLGYSTEHGEDNPVHKAWSDAGGSPEPGRLNSVRHVVYKSFLQPWRASRLHLPWLLQTAGVENIDGEALVWAAQRLTHQPDGRKVLLVISDGTPCDTATTANNDASLLEEHLRSVIEQIEAGPIQLAAIGTGRNVGRFYRHSLTLRQPEDIAAVLFEQLADLLAPPTTGKAS
jgi:cobaltochelatase CobT